jgi:nucleoside-diphosphate kinase
MGNFVFIRKKHKLTMTENKTFTMIKPDAVAAGHTGAIIQQIEAAGYKITALKKVVLSEELAGKFYAIHKERPFFASLVEFMSSGPIVPMILEKDNAVTDFRAFIGSTDPAEAAEGTIRKQFAKSKGENAIHGSDSDENAQIEGSFFFSNFEKID